MGNGIIARNSQRGNGTASLLGFSPFEGFVLLVASLEAIAWEALDDAPSTWADPSCRWMGEVHTTSKHH